MTLPQSQPASPNSIEQIIIELGDELDLTSKEIADVLWLALEFQKFDASSLEQEADLEPQESLEPKQKLNEIDKDASIEPSNISSNSNNQPNHDNQSVNSNSSNKTSTSTKEEKKVSVYSASSHEDSLDIPIGIPDAPSIREPLTLARAFRPLMRRVPTGRKFIIDEAATVQRIAEERICIPILKAEPEPWLDLALVIDESHSMLIWGHTIRELKQMFKNYGIFRDIRIWGLQPDEAGKKLQLFSRLGSDKRLTDPQEIIDPTGRRLILVVSDCVSNIWRKGMMFPVLKTWTQKQPLAILQMLPEWMWRRTALDLGTAVGFKSSIMGIPNQQLSLHKPLRRSRRIGFEVEERSKIPVITLNREYANQWSQMLIGKADALVTGYLLPPELKEENIHPLLQREQNAVNNIDAAARVDRFRNTASPLARQLAGLLAASPVINLPVVRLIQSSLLPKSTQIQVAEVFLGGLLRPKSKSLEKIEEIEQETNKLNENPDLVQYEFIDDSEIEKTPKIRDLFLKDAPVNDSVDVVNAVSRYIAEQLRVSMSEFMALLKAPQEVDEKQTEDTIKPFAYITATILRNLGGEYAEFADELETNKFDVDSKTYKSKEDSETNRFENIPARTSNSQLYALLIGIDKYESNPYYPNLRGCVNDIDLVDRYLRQILKIPSEQIWKLTAPASIFLIENGKSVQSSSSNSDRRGRLPTYANIIEAFKVITDAAKSGDQVYIHYSGHGTQVVTIYPELKGADIRDNCIVPMDIGDKIYDRYLRDVEIATLLKRITEKECIVTFIFDSYLGGATKKDYYHSQDSKNNEPHTISRKDYSLVAPREELIENWKSSTRADQALLAGWLPDPTLASWLPSNGNFVFLSACSPLEHAHEYSIDEGKHFGALTYWMFDTLTNSNSVLDYKSLYNRVKAMIQSKFPNQSPMLAGNGDLEVFGNKRKYVPYTVAVTQVDLENKKLTLDAGLVQGLNKGTRFAIYAFDAEDLTDKTKQIAIVEITDDLQAASSIAKILGAEAGGIEVQGEIQPGALAVMVAAPLDLIWKVRLFDGKEAGQGEQDLPAELVDKQTTALEKVRRALISNGWVVEAKEDEKGYYQVAVAKDGSYEICIGKLIENLCPALSIDDPDAPQKVVDRLVHLTKYRSLLQLDKPAAII